MPGLKLFVELTWPEIHRADMNRLSQPNTNNNCVQITIDNSVVGGVGRSAYKIYNMHEWV